jgi:hypothetical protein
MARTDPSWAHLRTETPGTPDEMITTNIDTARFLAERQQAIALHVSQKSPYEGLPSALRADFLTVEHLRRIRPPWADGVTEDDIMAVDEIRQTNEEPRRI